ncbi:MAG: TonB-dependent receptor [Proteobacteria bacterium]|nr:TonB-dependent receptor [Pseudomonadota bacterium]
MPFSAASAQPSPARLPHTAAARAIRLALATAIPAALLLGSAAARAAAASEPAAADAAALQEVVVTATRREERAQDVPVSASTLGGAPLAALTTTGEDLRVLSGRVPSLNVESSFGRAYPRFYIRGYGNADFHLNASQPVSLVLDDVVQENPILKGFPMFDLERVEVLRGPQGTLFGRNTPAGVVKFDSARPSFTMGGYLSASDATYNTANIEGAFNLPASPTLALRFSGLYQHRDNWVNNGFTGEKDKYEGYNERAGRAQALFKPNDDFEALLNVHGRSLNGTARLFRANIFQPGTNDFVPGFRPDTVYYDQNSHNEQRLQTYGANLRLQWNLGSVMLHSITGWESIHVYSRGDIDGGYGAVYAPPYGPGFIPFDDETADALPSHQQVTQEFRVESRGDSHLSWQAGAYYFYEGITVNSYAYDVLFGGGAQSELEVSKQTNHAWALFGSVADDLSEQVNVRAGVRYTQDRKSFGTLSYTATDSTSLQGNVFSADPSASNVSWDLSGVYKVTPEVNTYARVATGFRAPSIQPASPFGPQSEASSEKITSYELGVKGELLNRRLRFDADVFDYEVKDLQIAAVGGASNQTTLLNAKKSVGRGVELDLQARPVDPLLITANASYNFTKLEDRSLSVAVGGSVPPGDIQNQGYQLPGAFGPVNYAYIDGNPLPQAPKWVANATLRYGIPFAGGELYGYTDWSYRSEVNFFLYRAAEFTGKPLTLGGLRVGYIWDQGRYEVAAFGRNVTNKIVAVGGIDFNNLTGFINEPRIWGGQFSAKF